MKQHKILVKDLNPSLTCTLCGGYFIDATAVIDCLHVFCRGCILRYFENSRIGCPTCQSSFKKKNQYATFSILLRPDNIIQSLVYKLVPGLYAKEMQRREDFYRSTHNRASSSCSDDSVLGEQQEEEPWAGAAAELAEQGQFFAPDDLISLSLEYYQVHLDTTQEDKVQNGQDNSASGKVINGDGCSAKSDDCVGAGGSESANNCEDNNKKDNKPTENKQDRRYLRCPAAVSMTHLQKFIRMKYALSPDHNVDIIYKGEVLPNTFSLMDVAYTFKWKRIRPLRFFYRIFTPMKIRPIKIITNTSSTTGEKQLQIVPVKSEPKLEAQEATKAEIDAQNNRNKERLMAELQLQSCEKSKREEEDKKLAEMKRSYQEKLEKYNKAVLGLEREKRKRSPEISTPNKNKKLTTAVEPHCVYEYEEPDKEEIKRFAEKRDREWAMKKQLDEVTETHHVKKRKKNKHSKNELYKKRKIHAEITSSEVNQEESIKLKLKVTPHNGHKHKHHKVVVDQPKTYELTSLNVNVKEQQNSSSQQQKKEVRFDDEQPEIVRNNGEKREKSEINKLHIRIKSPEPPKREKEREREREKEREKESLSVKPIKSTKDADETSTGTGSTSTTTTRQAQTTFLKTFQSYAQENEKIKTDSQQQKLKQQQFASSLERKIANLQQQCTIEARNSPTPPINNNNNNNNNGSNKDVAVVKLSPTYPSQEFTVSKIESGVVAKRKDEEKLDKRPSLEITLIPPSAPSPKSSNSLGVAKPMSSPSQKSVMVAPRQMGSPRPVASSPKPLGASPRPISSPRPSSSPRPRPSSSPRPVSSSPRPASSPKPIHPVSSVPRPISSPNSVNVNVNVNNGSNNNNKTLNSPDGATQPNPVNKPVAKRPPPATIPLDRIKNKNLKTGISIIPKLPEKCDNIGALDLSKPHTNGLSNGSGSGNGNGNGMSKDIKMAVLNNTVTKIAERASLCQDKNGQLSNLQMLSKVASEHPSLNKSNQNQSQNSNNSTTKIQQQQTSSNSRQVHQTSKTSLSSSSTTSSSSSNSSSNSSSSAVPNLKPVVKIPVMPKLNEIKPGYRILGTQFRNMRPNQNQSIRNIPNPSLIVRQQNQNRLHNNNNSNASNTNLTTSNQQQQQQLQEKSAGQSQSQSSNSNSNSPTRSENNNSSSSLTTTNSTTNQNQTNTSEKTVVNVNVKSSSSSSLSASANLTANSGNSSLPSSALEKATTTATSTPSSETVAVN